MCRSIVSTEVAPVINDPYLMVNFNLWNLSDTFNRDISLIMNCSGELIGGVTTR